MSMAQGGAEMGGSLGGMLSLGIGALTGWGKPPGISRSKTAKYIGNTFMGSRAGGLTTYFDEAEAKKSGFGFKVQREDNRQAMITGLRNSLENTAAGLGGLRAQVSPGFGALTEAAVQSIRNAEERGRSDLAASFARRRLAGSSFAADKMSNLSAEAAQAERQARSEAFLQELQLTADLLKQQAAYEQQSFQTELDQLNLELSLVQPIQSQMNATTSAFNAAMTQAGMDYQQQMYKLFTWANVTGGAGAGRMGGAAAGTMMGGG